MFFCVLCDRFWQKFVSTEKNETISFSIGYLGLFRKVLPPWRSSARPWLREFVSCSFCITGGEGPHSALALWWWLIFITLTKTRTPTSDLPSPFPVVVAWISACRRSQKSNVSLSVFQGFIVTAAVVHITSCNLYIVSKAMSSTYDFGILIFG